MINEDKSIDRIEITIFEKNNNNYSPLDVSINVFK